MAHSAIPMIVFHGVNVYNIIYMNKYVCVTCVSGMRKSPWLMNVGHHIGIPLSSCYNYNYEIYYNWFEVNFCVRSLDSLWNR